MGRFIFLLWGVKWIIIHLFKLFPKFARFKGLSKNYVVKTVGMNSTRFSTAFFFPVKIKSARETRFWLFFGFSSRVEI